MNNPSCFYKKAGCMYLVWVFFSLLFLFPIRTAAAAPGYCIVTFQNQNGTSTAKKFEKLNRIVPKGASIVLPEVKPLKGYENIGWTTKKGKSIPIYKSGTKVTIQKHTIFYLVQKKVCTLSYYNCDGTKMLKSITVSPGSTVSLMGTLNEPDRTFIGWSALPDTSTQPEYLVGDTITLNKNLELYAVQYKDKKEYNFTAQTLPRLDTRRYSRLILVGDSRTTSMHQTMEAQFSKSVYKNVSFIAKRGMGLTWLKEEAYPELIRQIGSGGTAKKPIAIVFNLGVNDTYNLNDYMVYMKEIAPVLKAKNCKLYYMSINPVNSVLLKKVRGLIRSEADIAEFNRILQTDLCAGEDYTYINLFSYLLRTGFSYDSGKGKDSGISDGLHYSTRTYKRIYAYIINKLNQ